LHLIYPFLITVYFFFSRPFSQLLVKIILEFDGLNERRMTEQATESTEKYERKRFGAKRFAGTHLNIWKS